MPDKAATAADSVYPETVDFDSAHLSGEAILAKTDLSGEAILAKTDLSGEAILAKTEGLSDFETAGIVILFRGFQKSENTGLGQKMPFPGRH